MEKFYIGEYLNRKKDLSQAEKNEKQEMGFREICETVRERFFQSWEQDTASIQSSMEIQKRAIVGYQEEVEFYKKKIGELIAQEGWETNGYPPWYESLVEGIYHENWGMAGLAEWFSPKFKESSSAKIIGERIYFLKQGRMCLMPQELSESRREQLIRAFLLLTPEERLDKEFHEIYLLDGTRITVFKDGMTKNGQDTIIFRRYVIPNYTFEEQARRGTIPEAAIPLFKAMVSIGYSIVCTGAVRSSKSTFLATWQSYENPELEGVMVETDPEIPLHRMMPQAPIVQLLADNEKLHGIAKNLLRSDADYFILAEARDGIALDTAVRIACKGTKRMKMTFHTRNPLDFPTEAAIEIVKATGGNLETTIRKVGESFDYLFHFVQLADKSKKRLKGIYEMGLTKDRSQVYVTPICSYRYETDDWVWFHVMGHDKVSLGKEENPQSLEAMQQILKKLAGRAEG